MGRGRDYIPQKSWRVWGRGLPRSWQIAREGMGKGIPGGRNSPGHGTGEWGRSEMNHRGVWGEWRGECVSGLWDGKEAGETGWDQRGSDAS